MYIKLYSLGLFIKHRSSQHLSVVTISVGEKKGHMSLSDNELTLSSCVRKKKNTVLVLEIDGQAFPETTGPGKFMDSTGPN